MGSGIVQVRVVTKQGFTDLDKAELVLNIRRVLEDQIDALAPDGLDVISVVISNSEHIEQINNETNL